MSGSRRISVMGLFLDTVEKHQLLSSGDRVLAAVSGGADSVCLFDLLRLAAGRFKLQLFGFHMNHGLREGSKQDELFVQGLFARHRTELVVVRADVAGHARRHRLGIEEAGRELRYRHMERIANRLDCSRIALGHTANDNIETMLLNLVRGAGMRGLAGIPVRRDRYIRPLIELEREALERHLRARSIAWVEDESNDDTRFRRNLLRSRVVSVLKELNPAAVANARRAAGLLAEDDEFLDALAAEACGQVAREGHDRIQIDTERFANYNRVLKRRIIKQLLPELEAEAVDGVIDFCGKGKGGRLVLTNGVRGRLRQGVFEFERTKEIMSNGR